MHRLVPLVLLGVVVFCSAFVLAAAPKKKGNAAKNKGTSKSKMTKTFEGLDKNKDWELSFKELAVALDPQKLKQAQQVFDKVQSETDPKSKFRKSLNVTEFQKGYAQFKALTVQPQPKKKKKGGKKKKKKG